MKTAKNLLKKATACGMVLILFVLFLAAASPQKVYAGDGYTLSKYKVKVKHGYLALRSKKTIKRSNEIGKLYTGDSLIHCPTDSENSTYWYVYSPKLNKLGYVNRNYLRYYKEYTGDIDYYVKVKKGYLALRNAKAYKRSNETGKMYNYDDVIVLHKSRSTDYWTVYSPDLEKAGYTNKHYLRKW